MADTVMKISADVLVIGGGNFGTCLARHLARKNKTIIIYDKSQAIVRGINQEHKNPHYMSEYILPDNITATDKADQIDFSKIHSVIVAVPVQAMGDALKVFVSTPLKTKPIICASKGIDMGTKKFPIGIIHDVLGLEAAKNASILSGPSFAAEVMDRQPTAVAVASMNKEMALQAQTLFHDPYFRVYTSEDPIGLEVAGALKNVMAIAAGACVGLGFQVNTMAALITRGLAEIARFGVALGAERLTFMGLAGVGDLFLTCNSEKSRNYSTGFLLAQGTPLEKALNSLGSVAEGVYTAKAAYEIAQDLKIDAPITQAVYHVLYEGADLRNEFEKVINRDPKSEIQ